jgi:predicted phosphoribosyltransferase
MTFRDFADAGERLAPHLVEWVSQDNLVVAVAPGGVPVATAALASALLPAVDLHIATTELGVEVAGRTVVVIDDGVESGSAARRIGQFLRTSGATFIVFAVPVCPAPELESLRELFDVVITLDQPAERQPLRQHYERFE